MVPGQNVADLYLWVHTRVDCFEPCSACTHRPLLSVYEASLSRSPCRKAASILCIARSQPGRKGLAANCIARRWRTFCHNPRCLVSLRVSSSIVLRFVDPFIAFRPFGSGVRVQVLSTSLSKSSCMRCYRPELAHLDSWCEAESSSDSPTMLDVIAKTVIIAHLPVLSSSGTH